MNTLTPQEIAKVFALYYGCEVKYMLVNDTREGIDGFEIDAVLDAHNDAKILLTPLSEITDEHAVNAYNLCAAYPSTATNDDNRIRIVKEWLDDSIFPIAWNGYKYLISCGYAVPLSFGIDHWANGKTAIELGIAIPNPTPSN